MKDISEQTWCYFRNLVHAVYREARHIGEPDDYQAKCHITEKYLVAAQKCRENRDQLKSTVPFRKVAGRRTDDIIACYETLTGLSVDDLIVIFREMKWKPQYGGEKWATITEVLVRLKHEIDQSKIEAAWKICATEVRSLHHNSGPLVPSHQEWSKNKWLQEKWPDICEDNT